MRKVVFIIAVLSLGAYAGSQQSTDKASTENSTPVVQTTDSKALKKPLRVPEPQTSKKTNWSKVKDLFM